MPIRLGGRFQMEGIELFVGVTHLCDALQKEWDNALLPQVPDHILHVARGRFSPVENMKCPYVLGVYSKGMGAG